MNIRDIRQEEAVDAYLKGGGVSLVKAAPRFGKTFVGVKVLNALNKNVVKILIPRNDIIREWVKTAEILDFQGDMMFFTFTSLKKVQFEKGEFIIIDEPNELSKAQLEYLENHIEGCKILGLTGTASSKTEEKLERFLGMNVCYRYSIAQGVKDGIIADYKITVLKVPLDDTNPYISRKGKSSITERRAFRNIEFLKDKAHNKQFFELKQISIIQNSISKMNETKKLLQSYKQDRVLVFCGTQHVANQLEIPVYHSGKKDQKVFEDFCNGVGENHLATIKLVQSGITVKPIHIGIMNYISGNPEMTCQKISRMLGIEYDNIEKRANIIILCSTEEFEIQRIKTALSFFEQDKITWI